MVDSAGDDRRDPLPAASHEQTADVWHVTAYELEQAPWCRFTVEARYHRDRATVRTVNPDEVLASLRVWLRRVGPAPKP